MRNNFKFWYPVLTMQQLYLGIDGEGERFEIADVEANAHILHGKNILCGAEVDVSQGRTNQRAPAGLHVCDECVRVYKTMDTDETRKLDAWIRATVF